MQRVLVTDARLGSAISIIRSLGARGFQVVAADSEPDAPGFFSRYAADRLRYPPPATDAGGVVETLLRAARDRRLDLIVPVTDDVILPLAAARERFAGDCKLALPPDAALMATRDKRATLELARRLGVPTPATAVAATAAEARRAALALGWPVVLKPRFSRVRRADGGVEALGVAYAGGFARLGDRMRQFEGRCDVLVQEYLRGEADGVELLLDAGRPLAAFQHRRLREVPITGGASSLRESVPIDPTLYDYSVRLLGALGWTGLAMVEFKVGPDGPKLMEINGRVWGSLPLAVKSGMDFPLRAADLYLSGIPSADGGPDTTYRIGVRSRNLELEAVWIASVLRGERRYPFLAVPRRREALAAALRLPVPSDGYDILSADDLRPGALDLIRIAGKLRRKVADAR